MDTFNISQLILSIIMLYLLHNTYNYLGGLRNCPCTDNQMNILNLKNGELNIIYLSLFGIVLHLLSPFFTKKNVSAFIMSYKIILIVKKLIVINTYVF